MPSCNRLRRAGTGRPAVDWLSALLTIAAAVSVAEARGSAALEENGVLVLTNETMPQALAEHARLLVEFYAPWCGHCKALEPEFARAAAILRVQNSDERLAKLDVAAHSDVSAQQGIDGVPMLRLFVDGKRKADYAGERSAESIVAWLDRRSRPSTLTLTDAAELETLKRSSVAVVGFFKDVDSPAAKAFAAAADQFDEAKFAITSSDALFAENGVEGLQGVVLFKRADETRSDFAGDYTVEALSAFITQESQPLVVDLNPMSVLELFTGDVKTVLLLFIGKRHEGYDRAVRSAGRVAAKYRGKIQFSTVDPDMELCSHMIGHFSLKKHQLPAYRLAIIKGADMKWYRPETEEMSEERIASFLARYEAGQLQPQLLSEELPSDWDAHAVKVLVGTNYDVVTRGSGKKVIVQLYTPRCRRCKQLAPIWEQLGEIYEGATDLTIAKFDADSNEVSGLQVSAYPAIRLYIPGNNKAIDYAGKLALEDLIKFIGTDGAADGAPVSHETLEETKRHKSQPRDDTEPSHSEL